MIQINTEMVSQRTRIVKVLKEENTKWFGEWVGALCYAYYF